MAILPIVSGEQCIRALSRLGYRRARQRGSHVRLTCENRLPITVPLHPTLDRGTLRSILRVVDMDAAEFLALLK
jgi:predicted RNA binding protein YcfA (HicA-like mRNA interferase family)